MAVRLAPKTDQDFQDEAFTRQFVDDKLAHYREVLLQRKAGVVHTPSLPDVRRSLNTWLDELCALAEIRWVPSPEEELKMAAGWRNDAQ